MARRYTFLFNDGRCLIESGDTPCAALREAGFTTDAYDIIQHFGPYDQMIGYEYVGGEWVQRAAA